MTPNRKSRGEWIHRWVYQHTDIRSIADLIAFLIIAIGFAVIVVSLVIVLAASDAQWACIVEALASSSVRG